MSQPLELDITRAHFWNWPHFALTHPDPTTRTALLLGWLSLALGILSIVLAVL